jgi:hypothetical protein
MAPVRLLRRYLRRFGPYLRGPETVHICYVFANTALNISSMLPTSSTTSSEHRDSIGGYKNRCEPPPELPLASPYSSIVYHLSGSNSHALTQILPKTSRSVDGAPKRVPASVHFHYAPGLDTHTLAWILDSLVRVSRRAAYSHYVRIVANVRTSIQATMPLIASNTCTFSPSAVLAMPECMHLHLSLHPGGLRLHLAFI